MPLHAHYKFSITIHSDELAVVYCLRALSKYSQRTGNNNISWGGTKDRIWKKNNHQVTFHFSDPAYREDFVSKSRDLLPMSLWTEIRRSDNDPATPVG